ncbi:uncharacterized protein B0H18DRAFT_273240 [Fomitopsis serialis]|uniref:uncharacterized protein n=1 Tax=Fomitopsis serialis TaxID=139415 RepID=UPI0020075B9C|nr:uncharacterized protein B0H18DRAFT_273240 [Neoantrodia serialis]KAH9927789.1 hypothetical protein B0H18DRAFT_273240 [Neoantrodia serialis]
MSMHNGPVPTLEVLAKDGPDILNLPRPGQPLREDRNIETVTFTITKKTTKQQLSEKLKDYGLSMSGNRSDLIERLRQFAQDRTQWAAYVPSNLKALWPTGR